MARPPRGAGWGSALLATLLRAALLLAGHLLALLALVLLLVVPAQLILVLELLVAAVTSILVCHLGCLLVSSAADAAPTTLGSSGLRR